MRPSTQQITNSINAYWREARELYNLRSSFRQSVYIAARMNGKTPEQAIAKARGRKVGL